MQHIVESLLAFEILSLETEAPSKCIFCIPKQPASLHPETGHTVSSHVAAVVVSPVVEQLRSCLTEKQSSFTHCTAKM